MCVCVGGLGLDDGAIIFVDGPRFPVSGIPDSSMQLGVGSGPIGILGEAAGLGPMGRGEARHGVWVKPWPLESDWSLSFKATLLKLGRPLIPFAGSMDQISRLRRKYYNAISMVLSR